MIAKGTAKIAEKIHPQKGKIKKKSGNVKGKFRIKDCRVEHGEPSISEMTPNPIKRFPIDCPSYRESEIQR